MSSPTQSPNHVEVSAVDSRHEASHENRNPQNDNSKESTFPKFGDHVLKNH